MAGINEQQQPHLRVAQRERLDDLGDRVRLGGAVPSNAPASATPKYPLFRVLRMSTTPENASELTGSSAGC
jgi:hypothetical protein